MQNILRFYAGKWFVQAGLGGVLLSVLLVPLASIPLFIMHQDSHILLCYFLNERNLSGFWEHSIFYWILLGFDSAWFYALLTFFVLCANLLSWWLTSAVAYAAHAENTEVNVPRSEISKFTFI